MNLITISIEEKLPFQGVDQFTFGREVTGRKLIAFIVDNSKALPQSLLVFREQQLCSPILNEWKNFYADKYYDASHTAIPNVKLR